MDSTFFHDGALISNNNTWPNHRMNTILSTQSRITVGCNDHCDHRESHCSLTVWLVTVQYIDTHYIDTGRSEGLLKNKTGIIYLFVIISISHEKTKRMSYHPVPLPHRPHPNKIKSNSHTLPFYVILVMTYIFFTIRMTIVFHFFAAQ